MSLRLFDVSGLLAGAQGAGNPQRRKLYSLPYFSFPFSSPLYLSVSLLSSLSSQHNPQHIGSQQISPDKREKKDLGRSPGIMYCLLREKATTDLS